MRDIHSSSRFDREPALLRGAVKAFLMRKPDFISFTEIGTPKRAAVLRETPYALVYFQQESGVSECALLSRDVPLHWEPVKLSDLPIPRRGGNQCWALHVQFEDHHHRVIIHMPSGVEGLRRVRRNKRGRIYRDCIKGLKALVATLEGPVVITADWNLNGKRRWVRRYLESEFPGFRLVLPDKPTHGHRIIDFSLVRGFAGTARTISSFGSSDHRAVLSDLVTEEEVSWRVAESLDTLLAEINAAAPNRSKVSDGSIGDAAHASRDSDHNPWVIDANGVGVVRARDFTHDPAGGLDCNVLARRLARKLKRGKFPALGSGAYVIWNKRIISRDRISEGWRAYTGSNTHERHLHLSVALEGYDTERRWWVFPTRRELAVKVLKDAIAKAAAAGNKARVAALRFALKALR